MRACYEKLDCAFAVDLCQLLLTYLSVTFLINPSENHSFYEPKGESSRSLDNFDTKIPFKRREPVQILVLQKCTHRKPFCRLIMTKIRCSVLKKWEYTAKDGRSILVRTAQRGDAPKLHEGFHRVVDEGTWLPTFSANSHIPDWVHWIDKTNRNRDILLIAFLDGEYAGHLTLQPEEWNASQHVAKLGIIVIKECRKIHVGRSLMLAVEEIALDRDFTKIVLSTFDDNEVAKALYLDLGYRVVGIRKKHFNMPNGFIDEVLMEKEIC